MHEIFGAKNPGLHDDMSCGCDELSCSSNTVNCDECNKPQCTIGCYYNTLGLDDPRLEARWRSDYYNALKITRFD